MLDIERALRNERLLRALTGLNRKGLEQIGEVFEKVYQADIAEDTSPRRRARGGGRKARLQRTSDYRIFHCVLF